MLFGEYFHGAIYVTPAHNVLEEIGKHFRGDAWYEIDWQFLAHAMHGAPVYIALAGVFSAWLFYIKFPAWPGAIAARFSLIYRVLMNKYGCLPVEPGASAAFYGG